MFFEIETHLISKPQGLEIDAVFVKRL